jgi:Ca2+-transporting ATPase
MTRRIEMLPSVDVSGSIESAVRKLASDLACGLESAEAERRLRIEGANELPPDRGVPWWKVLTRQVVEPMALMLIAAAAIAGFALNERLDAIAILVIVVLNAGIGMGEETRAARALDALRTMEAPTAKVIRGGVLGVVASRELVAGDLVMLSAGDRVPADIRLVDSTFLQVDESLLTGESLPAEKDALAVPVVDAPLGDRTWMAFTGTYVVGGSSRGIVEATGERTLLGRIAAELRGPEQATPLQRELRILTARLGAIAILVAVGVFALTLVRTGLGPRSIEEAFLASVALAVAAVPEGLATVVTVALALGVRRMADRGAIVRRIAAVETLGAASVILTDKTGTLTQNRMVVDLVATADGQLAPAASVPPRLVGRVRTVAVLCNDASLRPEVIGDPVDIALLEAFEGDDGPILRSRFPRVAHLPFDAARRRMTTMHRADGRLILLSKGAPEEILALCRTAAGPDRPFTLTTDRRAGVLRRANELAAGGMRMLALADRELDGEMDIESAEGSMTLVALVGLRDPVRPEAAAAVAETRSAGISLVMVTGDHPGTASRVATEVGLADSPTVLSGADLRRDGIPIEPLCTPVYARVDPDQKLALVETLQARGYVVAVTGDGVNDAPALRKADIGIAMGRSGSDAAREAADMVVTDDDLATLVSAVREGRGIFDNIRKVVEYLVAGNFSEILVVVGSLLLIPSLGVPLLPLQLLWINLLTDGLPAVALGLDPADPTLMRRAPRPPDARILSKRRIGVLLMRGIVIASAALGALAITRFSWDASWLEARAAMFTVLVVAHLLYTFVVRGSSARLRGNPTLLIAVCAGIGLQLLIVALPSARGLFSTAHIDLREWVLVAVLGVAPMALMIGAQSVARRRGSRAASSG